MPSPFAVIFFNIIMLASSYAIGSTSSEVDDEDRLPRYFQHAVENKEKILLIHINDFYADGDSIMSACHTLISVYDLKNKYSELDIKLSFGSSDEFNSTTLKNCYQSIEQKINKLIANKGISYAQLHDDNLRIHYQKYLQLIKSYQNHSTLPFRIQDAAVTLFPIADVLNQSIDLFIGDVRDEQKQLYAMTPSINVIENSNPYFGNFGYNYQQHDLDYIQRINRHKTLVSIVNDGLQEKRQIFIHNGGSLKLLSELAIQSHLAQHIYVLLMAFKQPIPGLSAFDTYPSHNESLNMQATQQFLQMANNFKSVDVIDSNTGYYAPMCLNVLPSFEEYITSMGLKEILSSSAYQNLIETQEHHYQRYGASSQSYMKFTDSLLIAYQMGMINIPMAKLNWQRSNDNMSCRSNDSSSQHVFDIYNYSLVPSTHGAHMSLPYLQIDSLNPDDNQSTHPFARNPNDQSQIPQKSLTQALETDMVDFLKFQAHLLKDACMARLAIK